ncbi:MAG: 50S ribosomal protein L23 [Deltaproteobacteria bacterium]|jgi:ribosomal protein L23|nr:50S ribosomal protein L23 [Deltaproteobacteria bacterium]
MEPTSKLRIIKKVFVSERASDKDVAATGRNAYLFEVSVKATKPMIRAALTQAYADLKPENIHSLRTLIKPGKYRRRGRKLGGYTPERKKCVLTLRAGFKLSHEEAKMTVE